MLTYDLNRRGEQSIYEYLYQCIRSDILDGVLTAGERLPSKRSLAHHLNIGVITVANAYEQLLTEGYNRTPSPARPRRMARTVKIFRFMHFSLPLYQKQKIRLPARRFAGDSSFDTASASVS